MHRQRPVLRHGRDLSPHFGKVYTVTSVRFNGGHPHNQMVALDECAIGRYFNVTRFRLLCDDELRFEVE